MSTEEARTTKRELLKSKWQWDPELRRWTKLQPHGKNARPSLEFNPKALGLAEPDSFFRSPLVSLFIRRVMRSGKRSVAKKIVMAAFKRIFELSVKGRGKKGAWCRQVARDIIRKRGLPKRPRSVRVLALLVFFERAVLNVRPSVKVLIKKRGRTKFYYPRRARAGESVRYALKWVVDGSTVRSGRRKGRKLSQELRAATRCRGAAWDTKRSVYRLATTYRFFFPRRKGRTRWKGRRLSLKGTKGNYRLQLFRADWPDYWESWNKSPAPKVEPYRPNKALLIDTGAVAESVARMGAQLAQLAQERPPSLPGTVEAEPRTPRPTRGRRRGSSERNLGELRRGTKRSEVKKGSGKPTREKQEK